MTHRGRRLALLFIALVVLGLVLNNIAGRTSATRTAADGSGGGEPTTPAVRPLAPLYVPRPASLISGGYGGALSGDATPREVARAFAGTYLTYDPDRTSAKDFVDLLPRLAPAARPGLVEQLPDDYRTHLSAHPGATPTGDVSARDEEAEKNGRTEVTVDFAEESDATSPLHVTLTLAQDSDGWDVTSVALEEG